MNKAYPRELKFVQLDTQPDTSRVEVIVFLCHGFGAPGNDLLPIADMVVTHFAQNTQHSIRFIVPEAPLSLDEFPGYDARAWWEINMEKLAQAMGGDIELMYKSTPDGLTEARELLLGLIRNEADRVGLPLPKIILAGFSQGAMLSTEVALTLPGNIGGLCVFSGTLIREETWKEQAKKHQGLRILQSHGTTDMILQMFAAERLKETFEAAGLEVEFIPFNGPHTIPEQAILAFAQLIAQVATE